MNTFDCQNRLPLHYAIDTVVQAVVDYPFKNFTGDVSYGRNSEADIHNLFSSIDVLIFLINMSPETLEKRDRSTGLYPFMQVVSTASERFGSHCESKRSNAITVSFTYSLLLQNPSIACINS
jgi:hypothetical protein